MTDALARIRTRHCCRTFRGEALELGLRAELERIVSGATRGAFGTPLRFRLLEAEAAGPGQARLGTYGIAQGAPLFLAGAVRNGPMALEDYGWVMEELVLELTGRGLGTCWMAGTFDRRRFALAMDLADEELVPAISPVGLPASAPSAADAVLHTLAGSDRRRPWRSLFFRQDPDAPFSISRASALTPSDAGAWQPCLEAVRLAPSARNAQPWRIFKEPGDNGFRLLLAGPVPENSMRRLDAGIAMCHFALAAGEIGLPGRWVAEAPHRSPAGRGLVAVARWQLA